MTDRIKPSPIAAQPCKICGGTAPLFGVVDFHKSCVEARNIRLPLSGLAVYYRRCSDCGFLFTNAFDKWSAAQFKTHIYNDHYKSIDPDYEQKRPNSNARAVIRLFGKHKNDLRILDYGGGNDAFCVTLRANGFREALTYDPMVPGNDAAPDGKFDLITCFETLEHLLDPASEIGLIIERLTDPGLVLFSTLVQPAEFDKIGVNWWYVGPRNGHISIFSRRALNLVWLKHGFKLGSFNNNLHAAFRTLPAFATHLIKSKPVQPQAE